MLHCCSTQGACQHSSCRAKLNYAAGYRSAMFVLFFSAPPPNTQGDMFSKPVLNYYEAALYHSHFLSVKPKAG